MKLASFTAALLSITLFVSFALGQESARHPGILLYEEGKYATAVASLQSAVRTKELKTNAALWNYLGLAYLRGGYPKKAKKPLEMAVRLEPSKSVYRANLAYAYFLNKQLAKSVSEAEKALQLDSRNITALHIQGQARLQNGKLDEAEADADLMASIDPKYPNGYLLKSDVLLARFVGRIERGENYRDLINILIQAFDVLSAGIENSRGRPNRADIESRFETIGVFYKHFARDKTKDPPPGSPPEPGVTPMKILSKPRATYSDEARRAGINGTVKILVLLGADGKVGPIIMLTRLGFGLDETAVRAARQIKFEPKTVNGKPVSSVVTMEYSFTIF